MSRRRRGAPDGGRRGWATAILRAGLAAGVIAAIVIVTSASMRAPTPPPPRDLGQVQSIRTALDGQHVGMLIPPRSNGVLVIAAHGHGRTAEDWLSGPRQKSVRTALLRGGYSLASSDASDSAWGNPRSVADYVALHAWAQRKAEFSSVALIGESMGGLASLQLASLLPGVKAWIGIYPVCNLESVTTRYFASTSVAWPDGTIGRLSPVALDDVRGLTMIFFASPDDDAVSKSANTDLCARRARTAGADVRVIATTGAHGDASAFQPRRVVAFLDAATGN